MSMHLSYWQPKLPYLTKARAEYLKANVGIDPALLPEDLGVSKCTSGAFSGNRVCESVSTRRGRETVMRFVVVNDRQPQGRLTRLTLLRVASSCCQRHTDLRIASPRRPLNSLTTPAQLA